MLLLPVDDVLYVDTAAIFVQIDRLRDGRVEELLTIFSPARAPSDTGSHDITSSSCHIFLLIIVRNFPCVVLLREVLVRL